MQWQQSSSRSDLCTPLDFAITTQVYRPLPLGLASLASGFGPEDSVGMYRDLQLAREGMVLLTDSHLAYLCVSSAEELAGGSPDGHRVGRLLRGLSVRCSCVVVLTRLCVLQFCLPLIEERTSLWCRPPTARRLGGWG